MASRAVLSWTASVAWAIAVLRLHLAAATVEPIALHLDNPHYFLWRGKPTVLITSGEHYGAVLNLDFDYVKYLDTLARDGLNLTRTFTGAAYVEPRGAFGIARNTLAPAPGRFICPWARSDQPGYAGGGNRFDLNRWDEAYFNRLRDFVAQASRRGIVVEVNLFCPFYEEAQWLLSPFCTNNNVNGLGKLKRTEVYTLDKSGPLLTVQERFVREMVHALAEFDNVYYELCNEPYFGGVTLAWQRHMAALIQQAQRDRPRKQLISQNIANQSARITDPDPNVSIFNFHYASPPDAVGQNYHLNKVIGDNETGFQGTNDAPYRLEAWDFIVAEGGLFNHLDYSFAVGYEDGTFVYPATQPGGGNPGLRKQLRVLADFINSFNFTRMQPDNSVLAEPLPEGLSARALVEPGRAWAIYCRPGAVGPYSARWTGQIQAPDSGDYTFHTFSNDGVRLWIDGRRLIDNWTEHSETEDTATVALVAGRRYDLKLEYFYNTGQAVMRLCWSRPGQPKQPVPATALWLPDGSGHGLKAEYFGGPQFNRPWTSRTDRQVNFAWGTRPPVAIEQPTALNVLALRLPAGSYRATWLSPITGHSLKTDTFDHAGGVYRLTAPANDGELALRLMRH